MTMQFLQRPPVWGLFVLALLLPGLSGCDQGSLQPPEVQNDLFQSYVAIGNSITAGFQSGGINKSMQKESYAVLLAEQMGTPFHIPALAKPGCPPPLAQAFPPVSSAPDVGCALRESTGASPLHNVAVPAAEVIDVLSNRRPASNPNALTSFILGGQTQIEAAKKAHPTFASVWIGNNDVLGAAIAGDTTLATSVDSFRARYSRMVSELESIGTLQGAVFVGVADVTRVPHLSRGAAYKRAIPVGRNAGAIPSNFSLQSCASAESGSVFVPYRHGVSLIGAAAGLKAFVNESDLISIPPTITLNCAVDRTVEKTIRDSISGPFEEQIEREILKQISKEVERVSLLTPQETAFLEERFSTFNQIIKNQIADKYGYVDPNPLFASNSDRIPAFPNLFDKSKPAFGPLFSLDGIHPSAETHRLVTNAIIKKIKATYDVSDQALPSLSGSSQ